MKIKIRNGSLDDLKKVKAYSIQKAQNFYLSCPFATKVYMAMKTKMPISFISDNWEEIISIIKDNP